MARVELQGVSPLTRVRAGARDRPRASSKWRRGGYAAHQGLAPSIRVQTGARDCPGFLSKWRMVENSNPMPHGTNPLPTGVRDPAH